MTHFSAIGLCFLACVHALPSQVYRRGGGSDYELLPNPAGGEFPPATYKYDSDFDYQSFNVVLQIEHIEYELFKYGIERYSDADFRNAGLSSDDRTLLKFFKEQEKGHEMAVAGLMGRPDLATARCKYDWPKFGSIVDYLDFNQKITRGGEAGVIGLISHLNSRPAATILAETVTTEARQQFAFRQLSGYFPVDVWFEPTITQAMTWTLIAPFIKSCPKGTPKIEWNNFPALTIKNPTGPPGPSNRVAKVGPALTHPGREIYLVWEKPGKKVGPDLEYTTRSSAGKATHVAWISQLGVTYTELKVHPGETSGTTRQPGEDLKFNGEKYEGNRLVNDTMFIVVVDETPYLTPFDLSKIEPHIVAGPTEYVAG